MIFSIVSVFFRFYHINFHPYFYSDVTIFIFEKKLITSKTSVSEFNEFVPRLKSAQNRFQSSAGLNLKKLNTILSGTNHI